GQQCQHRAVGRPALVDPPASPPLQLCGRQSSSLSSARRSRLALLRRYPTATHPGAARVTSSCCCYGDKITLLQQSVVGYQAQIAVSEDHFIVGEEVTRAGAENDSLLPMVKQVESNCGETPQKVLADAGLYSHDNA